MPGIIRTIELAVIMSFAAPLGYIGTEMLLSGKQLGGIFLALAVLMVVLQYYVTTPADIPAVVADKTIGRVAKKGEK